jgi:hypothetical protein
MMTLLSLLVAPGLAMTVTLGVLLALLAGAARSLPSPAIRPSPGAALALGSLALCGLAAGLLPGPFRQADLAVSPLRAMLIWMAVEAAAIVPFLPGLASQSTLVVRAASRELQLGVAGRCVFWAAVGVAIAADRSSADLPARLLALLGGLLALPGGVGLGPFGPEVSLSPEGHDESLDEGGRTLLPLLRFCRAAVLLMILTSAALGPVVPGLPLLLAALLAMLCGFGLLLRQVAALPRRTLPAALRWCWWRALPLTLAGLLYLAVL